MNKKQVIKLSKEFDETLSEFDGEYFDELDADALSDYDAELAQRIDAVYRALRRLRIQLRKDE